MIYYFNNSFNKDLYITYFKIASTNVHYALFLDLSL